MSIIISAFPGMGKTYSKRSIISLNIVDHESTPYKWIQDNGERKENTEFPKNYINSLKAILNGKDAPDVIYISSHSEVRNELNKEGIDYYLIAPYMRCKEIIIDRYKNRGNSQKFCDQLSANWFKYIDSINNETFPTIIKFNHDKFIDQDLLESLLESSQQMKEDTESFIRGRKRVVNPKELFWSPISKRKKFIKDEFFRYAEYIDWDILCKFNKLPEDVILDNYYNQYINWIYIKKNLKKYSAKVKNKVINME